jgi:hypothetical protein
MSNQEEYTGVLMGPPSCFRALGIDRLFQLQNYSKHSQNRYTIAELNYIIHMFAGEVCKKYLEVNAVQL